MPTAPLAFEEPTAVHLITLLAFLYLLQVFAKAAELLLGAGLVGQVAAGIVFGAPLAAILDPAWERTFLVLGYLGLVLIVFEGGLDFSPALFVAALPLATLAAVLGVLLPIALTFALFHGLHLSPHDAFAAGVALASTSLGTTFFVLRAQDGPDLAATRIGTTLCAAALIDDVIALVLLSVITSVAEGPSSSLGWTIGRPVVASLALAVLGPLVAFCVARPLYRRFLETRTEQYGPRLALFLGVCTLSAFLAIAYYAGSTMLLGAFLAGMFLYALPTTPSASPFRATWHRHIEPLQTYIFSPLFFASIGYTTPFLRLWRGRIVWRGLVYALLMALAKLGAGTTVLLAACFSPQPPPLSEDCPTDGLPFPSSTSAEKTSEPAAVSAAAARVRPSRFHRPSRADDLPPAVFLGTALVARGEIGVLILQVASLSDEAYEVAYWAVAVCTVVGPVAFGWVVRRWGKEIDQGPWGSSSRPAPLS